MWLTPKQIVCLRRLYGRHQNPVLADFSMARSHTQSMSIRKTANGPFGRLNWMAPEMISDGEVSQAIDVYAFGIIVWEMCAGMIPWAGVPDATIMFKVAMKGERPMVERGRWPAWCCDLMEACWHQDRKLRPIMADVVQRVRERRLRLFPNPLLLQVLPCRI
jgi:serine/threonine protein kinase